MTAIVGVLNKHGIAVAADSAETVGEGVKIYDKANKIFTLSKYHPVGIAIYNNTEFNSCIPWEIIIKMYRRHLGEISCGTIRDYAADFIRYVEDYQSKYFSKDGLAFVTANEIKHFWISEVLKKLPHFRPDSSSIDPSDLAILQQLLFMYKEQAMAKSKIPELSSVDYQSFVSCIDSYFLSETLASIEEAGGDRTVFSSLIPEALFEVFTRQYISRPSFSGLAIFGFGEQEIYPAIYEIRVFNSFAGKFYWTEKAFRPINNEQTAYIHPMAQKDVMQNYIEGISPQIEQSFTSITESTIRNLLSAIQTVLKPIHALSDAVGNIDLQPLMSRFQSSIGHFKQTVTIGPLMQTVATMEKEYLAELAENLIYLTSLKRRITPNPESVGGPVDVAIVSKGDGFIWLKRKHYFNPELNRCFFDKYFKS